VSGSGDRSESPPETLPGAGCSRSAPRTIVCDVDLVHGALVPISIDNPVFRKGDPNLAGQLGIGVPKPVTGLGILDTGASMSCIVGGVASRLGLLEVDAITLSGVRAAHDHAEPHETSRVRFGVLRIDGIAVEFPTKFVEVRPLGHSRGEPLLVLIGRDILGQAHLTWDGPAGTFQVSF